MNAEEVAAHVRRMLPDTRVLPVERLRHDLTLGCVDGRNPGCVAGAPGGNAGLLVLLLASLEELTGHVFDEGEVKALFQRYLQHLGHFYLHSDRPAVAALGRSLSPGAAPASAGGTPARGADAWESGTLEALLRAPPAALRARLLELLIVPDHVGCGHLRLLLSEPAAYQARPELTAAVIHAFFEALWSGDERVIFDVLPGDHHEEAVLQIHAGAPELLVACPHYGAMEFFVHHPDAVGWVETLQGLLAAEEGWVPLRHLPRLMEVQERLGKHQLQATLERLAGGLPVFDVHLDAPSDPASAASLPSRIRVTPAGVVRGKLARRDRSTGVLQLARKTASNSRSGMAPPSLGPVPGSRASSSS